MISSRTVLQLGISITVAAVLVMAPMLAVGEDALPPPDPIDTEPSWIYVVGPDGEVLADPRQPTTPLTVLSNDDEPPPLDPEVNTTGGQYDPELDAWVYNTPPDDPFAGALAYPPLDELTLDSVDCESEPAKRLQHCELVLQAVMPVLAFVIDAAHLFDDCGVESTVVNWNAQAVDSNGEWQLIGNGEWILPTNAPISEYVSAATDQIVLSLDVGADSCVLSSIEKSLSLYGRP